MTKPKLSLIFSSVLFILFCAMALEARSFPISAMYFPFYLSLVGILLTFINMIVEYRNLKSTEEDDNDDDDDVATFDTPVTHSFKAASLNFLWFVGYFAMIFTVGFIVATIIYLGLFLKKRTDFKLITIILSIIISIGFLIFLQQALDLKSPTGIIGLF